MNIATKARHQSPLLQPLQLLRGRLLAAQQAFNQRSPRERVLLALVGVALALASADTLWVGPAWQAYDQARRHHQQVQTTQAQLQRDTALLGPAVKDHLKHRRAEVQAWRDRVLEGEQTLRRHEDTLLGPDQMTAVLEQVLARHGQVQVRAMRSLDRVDLLPGQAAATAPSPVPPPPSSPTAPTSTSAAVASRTAAAIKPAPPALAQALRQHPEAKAAAPGAPTIYRHGVELVLEGSFNDLLAYLQALETMPQHVLWGPMSLQVQQYPVSQLTLRLYTISRQRHWLAF